LFKVCIDFLEITCCQAGDYPSRKGSSELGSMPFPPGVGESSSGEIGNTENYEVITADRAIDESNVGNRILRNMGWQEGLVSLPTHTFFILLMVLDDLTAIFPISILFSCICSRVVAPFMFLDGAAKCLCLESDLFMTSDV